MTKGKKSKVLALILAIALVAVFAVGCGGGGGGGGTSAPGSGNAAAPDAGEDPVRIAFLVGHSSHDFWFGLLAGMEEVKDEYNVKFSSLGADSNAATQQEQLETCISSGEYDVLWVGPVDQPSMNDAILAAQDAGMLVICAQEWMENADASIGIGEEATGYATGKKAAEWVNTNWPDEEEYVVARLNYEFAESCIQRMAGLDKGFEENVKGPFRFLQDISPLDTVNATEMGGPFFQANPDTNVILSISANGMYGFLLAAMDAGIPYDAIAGFGITTTEPAFDFIENGQYIQGLMGVGTDPIMARVYFDTTMKLIEGETFDELIPLPMDWIDISNVAQKRTEYYG